MTTIQEIIENLKDLKQNLIAFHGANPVFPHPNK